MIEKPSLWKAVGVIAVVLLAAGVGFEIYTYAVWGTLSPAAGPPPRVEWCGRRYYPAQDTITAAAVAAEPGGDRMTPVATTPSGESVLAAPMSDRERAVRHTSVCAMAVYVKVGSDRYLPYVLSGGP